MDKFLLYHTSLNGDLKRKHSPANCAIRATEFHQMEIRLEDQLRLVKYLYYLSAYVTI